MNSVGEVLSRARKKQGRSIIQVEEETKIPSKYIKALETDQFHLIPGDVYVKGFLRTYASHLGLDSSELVEEYKKIQDKKIQKSSLPEKERETTLITSVAKQRSKKKWVALGIAVLAIGFLAGLLWLGNVKGKSTKILGEKTKREKTPLKRKPESKPSPKRQPSSAPRQNVTIRVKVIDKQGCWLRVIADGNKVFEDTLYFGQEREWSANQSIFIRAGNARGLQVTQNGKNLGVFGQSNGVVERTFTSEQQ